MKKIMAVVIVALSVVCVVLVNFFGMQVEGAYDPIIPANAIALEYINSERLHPDSPTDYSARVLISYDSIVVPNNPQVRSFIVWYNVYPSETTYKSLHLTIEGADSDKVEIDSSKCLVSIYRPVRTFTIVAVTTIGRQLSTYLEVTLTDLPLRSAISS